MRKFIFDVDGTLTPSRQPMNPQFKEWFLDFMKREKVWIVTGSDYEKTVEQLGSDICVDVVKCYNCSGNDHWFKGKRVSSSEFSAPKDLYDIMHGWLQVSKFPYRTGNHIEERRGCINFSVVGRNAGDIERKEYVKYDLLNRERETIAYQINTTFNDITATVGGETGIDIHRTGADKRQILEDFEYDDEIIFFGDRMEPGGNDFPLASTLKYQYPKGFSHAVKDWEHAWQILKEY